MANGTGNHAFYIGEHLPAPNMGASPATINDSVLQGYDMISCYITNINLRQRVNEQIANARANGQKRLVISGLDAEETNIAPGEHVLQLVCFASAWLELDSQDPLIANASRQVLIHELAYAAFCGVNIVVVQAPDLETSNTSAFAQAIAQGLAQSNFTTVLVELPMHFVPSAIKKEGIKKIEMDPMRTWDFWNMLRTVCKYSTRLGIALQVPYALPAPHIQQRWLAEPVRLLMIPSSSFALNAKGYPVMTKQHQTLIHKYMKLRPYSLLSGTKHANNTPDGSSADENGDYSSAFPALGSPGPIVPTGLTDRRDEPSSYLYYLRHLHENMPPPSTVEKFGAGYQDYLQAPLQPLADNLESITYEVFEKDPVKYDQYEKAIQLALEDRKHAGEASVVIAVVGAGRGPLVTRCLKASSSADMPITLYAIEKNPNAYVHLLRHNRDTWQGMVQIVKTDMRYWAPPSPVDILVSELLGSFGDNELSPECLDGVQRVLRPGTGMTIPMSYTAHYTPIMAPKIHADIASRVATSPNSSEILETSYVVMLTAIEYLSTFKNGQPDIHRAWEFKHPLSASEILSIEFAGGNGNEHNEREAIATFQVQHRGEMHGIAGYFESVLYESTRRKEIIELSTRPDTIDAKSEDMISWFPIYFPLKTPLFLPDNSEVDISFWRLTDGRKVWYEWMAESYINGQTATTNGDNEMTRNTSRKRLGVSDLSSSKKNGCLM